MQDSTSFWTDIKHLEEQLAKSPDSFCFARLSDVYFKVGLIDDALHVARHGVVKHPRYLSGQKALSLACLAKGLNSEALAALEIVTESLPEDISSQKLLGRLYAGIGNYAAACQAFRTALEFAPEDEECRIELELIERSTGSDGAGVVSGEEGEDEIIDDLEILEDEHSDLEQMETESQYQPSSLFVLDEVPVSRHDPLSTGTLAELYVTQGFIHKALEIYRAILTDNPSDRGIAERVAELEAMDAGTTELDSESDGTFEEELGEVPTSGVPTEMFIQESETAVITNTPNVPPEGTADNALATFNGWLENIRRIKSCR